MPTRSALPLGLALLLLASRAAAQPTFTVNSLLDVPGGGNLANGVCETANGNGVCTLRAAIMEANQVAGGGATIVVPAGVYLLSRPWASPDGETTGDLDVLAAMTIEGRGQTATVIDGAAIDRIFDVADFAVTLRNLGVRNGGAFSLLSAPGGGIRNVGDLVLDDFASTATCVGTTGAVLYNGGSLTIRRSVISGGFGEGFGAGGGVYNAAGATLVIEDSLVSGNAASRGGGIANLGVATITRTTIAGNQAGNSALDAGGGGIHNSGTIELLNATVSGNTTLSSGGGIHGAGGAVYLVHSTVASNRANSHDFAPGAQGGGLHRGVGNPLVNLRNSIVAGNTIGTAAAPNECGGTITSGDYNVIGARSTCALTGLTGNVNASDAPGVLASFTGNGGFAFDHASSWGPTIPLASCVDLVGAALEVDGRGHARETLAACEPGAVEGSGVYAPDSVIGVELLRNGGGASDELGLAAADLGWVPPPYWEQVVGQLGQVVYGAPDFPTTADAPAGSGGHFFAGGAAAASAVAQYIDVSTAAAEIDSGSLSCRISGAFGGYLSDEDYATLYVEFHDENQGFLGELTIGGYSATDRANQTKLLPASDTGLVPPGTRALSVTLGAIALDGAYNDGYADDLSIVLPEPAAALAALTAFAALAVSSRRAASRAARGSA